MVKVNLVIAKKLSRCRVRKSVDRKSPLPGTYRDPAKTGFHHLHARYFDPQIRRFISADDVGYLGIAATTAVATIAKVWLMRG